MQKLQGCTEAYIRWSLVNMLAQSQLLFHSLLGYALVIPRGKILYGTALSYRF